MSNIGVINNPVTELFTKLIEECNEVSVIACKSVIHGLDKYHPSDPDNTNQDNLTKEVGDVIAVALMMIESGMINRDQLNHAVSSKLMRITKYLHTEENIELATRAFNNLGRPDGYSI